MYRVPFAIFVSSGMKDLEKQRVCMKFCLKLAKTFTETFHMLKQDLLGGHEEFEGGRVKEES
jgi:hypothetical protein